MSCDQLNIDFISCHTDPQHESSLNNYVVSPTQDVDMQGSEMNLLYFRHKRGPESEMNRSLLFVKSVEQ